MDLEMSDLRKVKSQKSMIKRFWSRFMLAASAGQMLKQS